MLTINLNAFNARFVRELLPHSRFPADTQAWQNEFGDLLLRSAQRHPSDPTEVATLAVVALEPDVAAALAAATDVDRAAMITILVNNLRTQLVMKYDPNRRSLRVLGTTTILGDWRATVVPRCCFVSLAP